ncbi:MAG: GNAT family N-acetyltransferase [Desulfobacterales bacterium]|nr:GNAT family N-acetyltransferase [Desulfobacterales bacterium]
MINFIELSRTHNRDNFDCGIEELNYFLKNLARQNLKKGLSRTFVAVDKNIPEEVLGFYTLSLFELSSEKLPQKYAKKYKGKVPAVKLSRLATAKDRQNQGLGRHMLINAIMRIISISEHAGVIGFFVDAKNKDVKKYYQKFGFISLPDHPLKLFLPFFTLQKMYEIAIQENIAELLP